MARTKTEKEKSEAISQELLRLTGEFCDQYLDEDYRQLAEKLVLKDETQAPGAFPKRAR